MVKQLIRWSLIPVFFLVVLIPFVCQILVFLFGEDYSGSPAHFSDYPESGFYEINPETLFDTLNREEANTFIPASSEIWYRDEPYYDSISWTQSDYLRIAIILSLRTWNEPLDLENWKVIFMYLIADCENNPNGFYSFSIVYYKPLGIVNFERQYTSRLIDIIPWQGLIRWGNGAVFSTPISLGWDGVDLSQFKIAADGALRIAENNGGSDVRRNVGNDCSIALSMSQLNPLPHRENWLVDYYRPGFYMQVDPYNGNHKILGTSQ